MRQRIALLLVALSSALVIGCASSRVMRDRPEFLFYWGEFGRNRIDTLSGTLVKDRIQEPPALSFISLSAQQRNQVVAWADSLGFWEMPPHVAPPDTSFLRTHSSSSGEYLLRLSVGRRTHTVYWSAEDASTCEPCSRFKALGGLIAGMVYSTNTWKRMPEAKGFYQ